MAEMKRKGPISDHLNSLPVLRASPLRGFHAVQSSEFQLPCSTPRGNNDNSRRKRVKFKELDRDRPSTCRKNAPAVPLKESKALKQINAKTSEFAFFKKFKEDASLRFNASPPCQKELPSKNFKSSDCFRAMDVKQAHTTLDDIQRGQRSMENNGTHHSHSDIFNRKRQKLRQFTQNMSLNGTDESYERGYSIVSMLLNRLIPQNKSDNNFEKLHHLPERHSSRLDYEHYLDKESSPCQLSESRGRVLSYSCFPTYSDDVNFLLKYRTIKSDCEFEEATLLDVNDSSFTAAVGKCRPLLSSRCKPLGGLYDQDEPLQLREVEPRALLLGWDIENIEDESCLSSQLTELDTFAMRPTSFADGHQPNSQGNFDADGLLSSPYPSRNSRNFYSLPNSSLPSYQIHGSSWHNIEKKEDLTAFLNSIHLNFSYVPKCPSQYNSYIDCKGGSNLFHTQSAHWFMDNPSDDGCQHSYVDNLWASSFVFDFKREYYMSGPRDQWKEAHHMLEFPLDEGRPEVPVDEERNCGSSDDDFLKGWSSFFIQPDLFSPKEVRHELLDKLSFNVADNEINVDKIELKYI